MAILHRSSKLNPLLGVYGADFIERAVGAISRLLPHVEMDGWKEQKWAPAGSSWIDGHRAVRVTVSIGDKGDLASGSIYAIVSRRRVESRASVASAIIDIREHDICGLVAKRISRIIVEARGRSLILIF